MTDLFNTETGLIEDVPDGMAEDAFMSGKYALNSKAPAFVVDPETKETYEIEATKAQDFLKRGFRFETKDEGTLRSFRTEVQNKGLGSSLKVAAKSALNEASLGTTGLAEDLTSTPIERAKQDIEEEENPISNIAGGLTGLGLSLYYGGPIWKGVGYAGEAAAKSAGKVASVLGKNAAQSTITKAAQGLARGAAEGAAISVPTGLTEAALGDHDTIGEALLAGATRIGEGAAVGTALSPIAGAIKIAGKGLTPEALNEQSRYFQLKQAGFRTPEFRKMEAASKQDLAEKGIRMPTKGEINEEVGQFLDDLGYDRALSTMFKGSEDRINSVKAGLGAIGERMNTLRDTVDTLVPNALAPQNIAKEVIDVAKKYKNTTGEQATSSAENVGVMWGMIDDAFNKAKAEKGVGRLTLGEAHALKQDLAEYALAGPMQFKSRGAQDMYNLWNSKIDSTLDAVKQQYGSVPELQTALKDLNKEYSKLKKYEPIFNNVANREAANNRIGLTDYISAGVGGSMGDFTSAAILGGLNYAKRNYGNQLASSALYGASRLVDKVGSTINRSIAGTIAGKALSNIKPASVGVLSRMVGEDLSKEDKTKQYEKVIDNINRLATDPDLSAQLYSATTKDLAEEAPMTQAALQGTMARAAGYLRSIAPIGVQHNSPLSAKKYIPSDKELASFERGLTAVLDPLSILEDMQNGTLTRDSVKAVKTVYPKLFAQIQNQLLNTISTAKTPLPYAVKLKASYILEDPAAPNTLGPKIKMLQENYVSTAKPTPRANTKITQAGRSGTEVDRVVYGQ